MLSFFGEQDLKDAIVARVAEHQRLDQIVQRVYWDGSKGCGIGCVLHSGERMAVERQLGLPVFWAYMNEHIFESLPKGEHAEWPLRLVRATPVGVDLSLLQPKFIHWLLSDPQGIRAYANPQTLRVIDRLERLYDRLSRGEHLLPHELTELVRAEAEAAEVAAAAALVAARAALVVAAAALVAARAALVAARAALAAARAALVAARAALVAARAAARAVEAVEAWGRVGERNEEIRRQADYFIGLLEQYTSSPVMASGTVEARHPWLVMG